MDEEKYMPKDEGELRAFDGMVKNRVMPYMKDLSVVLCAVLFLFLFCFRIAIVDGSSMKNTLVDGDLVLLLNSAIAGEPQPGDIVVINKQSYKNGTPIIKRVIATENQTIDINFSTGEVSVDGVILEEPYIASETKNSEGVTFPYVVEEGHIFVMGDNRDHSMDSRNPSIGTVDCREIVGKAFFLLSPGTDKGTQNKNFGRIGVLP